MKHARSDRSNLLERLIPAAMAQRTKELNAIADAATCQKVSPLFLEDSKMGKKGSRVCKHPRDTKRQR